MIWRHGMLLTLCLALCAVAALYFTGDLQTTSNSWSYADLRLVEAADADQPSRDLQAVYTRSAREALEIRLDMLEHAATPDYDLYLALESQPGGRRDLPIDAQADLDWDLLLVIPATGEMQALDSQMQPVPRAGLRVVRNPTLDQVTISVSQAALQDQNPNLQVWVTPAGGAQPADRSDPSYAGELAPPPARVLLAFWNTYPAYTPATALRRWNGAHTGPLGGSHGLLHLLRAAGAEQAPLALLDLKQPAVLSALDFIGGLGLVQQMARQGLLITPETLPDLGLMEGVPLQVLAAPAEAFQRAGEDFGLSPSPMRFAQPEDFPAFAESALLFADQTGNTTQPAPLEPTMMERWRNQRALTIQRYERQEMQAQSDGPSLEVRRALSQAALAAARPGGESAVLMLGGDLPESAWGAAAAANATLHYLKSRPWIRLLTAQDLLAIKAADGPGFKIENTSEAAHPAAQDNPALLEALSQAPANSLSQAAWQATFALFAPVYPAPAELPALRANYRGQVWSLLEAAGWADHPLAAASCSTDPDQDGQPECILASEQVYAQFEIESGALTHLFQRDPSGAAHQIIGPTSQVISGLSDPLSWQLSGGLGAEPAADPAVIPGAFAEAGMGYQPRFTSDGLTFTSADGSSQKTYELQTDGLRLTYQTGQLKTLQIPLLLDPWRRFTPGWSAGYSYNPVPSGWIATLVQAGTGQMQVEVRSNAALSISTFKDALPLNRRAEDPNQDYPPGYFLPFPLAEIRLGATPGQDTMVELIIKH